MWANESGSGGGVEAALAGTMIRMWPVHEEPGNVEHSGGRSAEWKLRRGRLVDRGSDCCRRK